MRLYNNWKKLNLENYYFCRILIYIIKIYFKKTSFIFFILEIILIKI